ncbi:TetR/AcrR family transcriptional regulator [Sporosarcina beigongshangi]|uniref:TetR/AcrR family transcriptional regulator n=1 Tax=Sporosarcina beigongshangi TaxID=2782538 RepID=UPI001939A276|nr:TetR/AcrR family transcriptional regulator [Sporosarcina beigongshangi]
MNNRKRQVLLVARRLFAEKGFTATSVQDILDESQISKGTFYNYFTSKNECLMAMLEYAHEEATIKRRELLIGQDIRDKNILAEQIVVRMHINREHNLLPIYESVFNSGDKDLKSFIIRHHFMEISWLTERLVDVYGEGAQSYAPDCAVILMGMMQHLIHFWNASTKVKIDILQLAQFTTRRIDAIISDMMATNDRLLGENLFENLQSADETKPDVKTILIMQLTRFLEQLKNDSKPSDVQYTQFLLDEIHSAQPRVFILETVTRSFHETFSDTHFESEVREIVTYLWSYVDTLKKEEVR